MSRKNETVFPSEVLKAIAYAKKTYPDDKFGDRAFKFDDTPREGANSVRWLTFSVLKQNAKTNAWEYIPLHLRVINVQTTANIRTEAEKKEKKQDYPGINLTFDTSTVGQNNEPYGQAKLAISNAFNRLMTAALKSGKYYLENKMVKLNVQTYRLINRAKGEKEKLEKGIIRVKIPFGNADDGVKIADTALPSIDVYDAEKRIENPKPGSVPFEPATDEKGEPLNYTTIRSFIRCKSTTSFVENLSGVCLSSQGASNPSKVESFLIVKKSKGNKIQASEAFDQNEFASMAGAESGTYEEPAEDETVEEKTVKIEDSEIANEFDDMGTEVDLDKEEPIEEPKPKAKPSKPVVKKPVKKQQEEDLDELSE